MSADDHFKRWYGRVLWLRLREACLRRDPICGICERAWSTEADHMIPWRRGTTPQDRWNRFHDLDNLMGLCHPCHSAKTSREDGGFGHALKTSSHLPFIARTGEPGKQFQASMDDKKLDAALGTKDEIAELLEGL